MTVLKMELSYEELRKKNLADNRRILAEIGLGNPFKASIRLSFKKPTTKRKSSAPARKPKRPIEEVNDDENYGSIVDTSRRKSARLSGQTKVKRYELDEDWEEEDEVERKRKPRAHHVTSPHVKVPANRPNHYGPVEGVDVGTVWLTRMECCRDGIHRPTVAGIHSGQDGAYSIALSGGYDDNVDWGECFTYTGEGGRDLKGTAAKPKNLRTAPQSKDQTLTRGNLALSRNVDTGNPVRVIRGYKLNSAFAPEEGYRYDGLYTVEKAWYTTGMAGFGVWKFALRRLDDQAPPPWEFIESKTAEPNNNNPDGKEESPVKSPKIIEKIKSKDESNADYAEVKEQDGLTEDEVKEVKSGKGRKKALKSEENTSNDSDEKLDDIDMKGHAKSKDDIADDSKGNDQPDEMKNEEKTAAQLAKGRKKTLKSKGNSDNECEKQDNVDIKGDEGKEDDTAIENKENKA